MIDIDDPTTTKKLVSALDKYKSDNDKLKRMALFLSVAGRELDDVDRAIELSHQAMEENDKGDESAITNQQSHFFIAGVCVNCGGVGGKPGPCPTGVREEETIPKPRTSHSPPKTEEMKVAEREPSEKAKRAIAAHKMVNKEIQRYAEEVSEPRLAAMLKGKSLPDNEPVDVETEKDGVELKTMVLERNQEEKITMDSYAQIRKINWERETGKTFHTVVSDDRLVYNANGEGEHDESKRIYYYRRGVAGSARIDSLYRCESAEELQRLIAMKDSELPKSARRTDAKHTREGTWEPITDKATGRNAFRNTKTGKTFVAKK